MSEFLRHFLHGHLLAMLQKFLNREGESPLGRPTEAASNESRGTSSPTLWERGGMDNRRLGHGQRV